MFGYSHFNLYGVIGGTILGLVGIGICVWGSIILKNAKASGSWPTVQGVVVESRVEKDVDKDSDGRTDISYHAKVFYRYEVENAEYTCDTVSFGEYGTDKADHAKEIVKRYPKGKEVNVHYNPDKPKTAVLEPGVTWSTYLPLGLGVVFLGAGVACCFYRY